MRLAWAGFVVFALLGGGARAQDAALSSFLQDVNARVPVPEKALVEADALQTLQAIAKEGGACAPTAVALGPITPATADRMAMQGIQSGQLKNLWVADGVPSGCPDAQKARFMVLALADGRVLARVVSFGETIAWPSLFRDTGTPAAVLAFATASRDNPGCDQKSLNLLSSRIVAKGPDLGPDVFGVRFAGSWDEAWRFTACNQIVEVPITFRADGSGGAYHNIQSTAAKLMKQPPSK